MTQPYDSLVSYIIKSFFFFFGKVLFIFLLHRQYPIFNLFLDKCNSATLWCSSFPINSVPLLMRGCYLTGKPLLAALLIQLSTQTSWNGAWYNCYCHPLLQLTIQIILPFWIPFIPCFFTGSFGNGGPKSLLEVSLACLYCLSWSAKSSSFSSSL